MRSIISAAIIACCLFALAVNAVEVDVGAGIITIEGTARDMDYHHWAFRSEYDEERQRLRCLAGCRTPDRFHEVLINYLNPGGDRDCRKGARYDYDRMDKHEIRPGQRYTGVWNGNCQRTDDPSCPASYKYQAFMIYGCELRNGTQYYVTHSYSDLHNALMALRQ